MVTPHRKRSKTSSRFSKKKRAKDSTVTVNALPGTDGAFWEIERVKAFRINHHRPSASNAAAASTNPSSSKNGQHEPPILEFLLQWKGPYEDTWELADCLCDSAMIEGRKLIDEATARQFLPHVDGSMLNDAADANDDAANDDAANDAAKPESEPTRSTLARKDRNTTHRKKRTEQKMTEDLWEIEMIKAFRTSTSGKLEFLVQWKGNYKDTWEPKENLTEVALIDGMRLVNRAMTAVHETTTGTTGNEITDFDEIMIMDATGMDEWAIDEAEATTPPPTTTTTALDDDTLMPPRNSKYLAHDTDDTGLDYWSDASYIQYRPIERISVADPDCRARVTLARLVGIPVVVTGHVGYAQFAQRWLRVGRPSGAGTTNSGSGSDMDQENDTDHKARAKDDTQSQQQQQQPEEQQQQPTTVSDKPSLFPCTDQTAVSEPAPANTEAASEEFDDKATIDKCLQSLLTQDEPTAVNRNCSQEGDRLDDTTGANIMDRDDAVGVVVSSECDETATKLPAGDETLALLAHVAAEESAQIAANESAQVATKESTIMAPETPLDLSKLHYVDVQKMSEDIGDELVPILRKNYDEAEPIKMHMSIRTFLRNCWPDETATPVVQPAKCDEDEETSKVAAVPKKLPRASLYLHQWLFTASETAVLKLCGEGKSNPLPNNILGDDLLRHWYNKERCNGDSPYQYLFMGNMGTMSKLHKDSGGLMITIAPIVGRKEVVLVHRDDGTSALYDLEAKLDKPDLRQFPMLYSTRVWKSIIEPGEILIMPQGTYHQCRNISPCLSYHRFHLDTVNLKAFHQSINENDCDHLDILWNSATELYSMIDQFVNDLRKQPTRSPDVPEKIENAISSLRIVHKVCRTTAMDFEKSFDREKTNEWNQLVGDIESTLHDFRFRRRPQIPPFRACHTRRAATRKLAAVPASFNSQYTGNVATERDLGCVNPDNEPDGEFEDNETSPPFDIHDNTNSQNDSGSAVPSYMMEEGICRGKSDPEIRSDSTECYEQFANSETEEIHNVCMLNAPLVTAIPATDDMDTRQLFSC